MILSFKNVNYILNHRKPEIFNINNSMEIVFEDEFQNKFYFLSIENLINQSFSEVIMLNRYLSESLQENEPTQNILLINDIDHILNYYLRCKNE